MMDVLVNKGLAAPLKDQKEGVYNDDQWEELSARARVTIRLHLGESIFFTIMDKTTAFELWDSLCSAWDGKSASNKVFLMKKLMRLSMKEGSNVSSHLNEFNALYSQLTSKGLNFDDEMKAIFLLCSLLASWDTFNTAISNSTHGGKLAFGDFTSALLTKEIRRANDEIPMLVNYLITSLHQAMANPTLQGEVQQQLQAYGILPTHQEEGDLVKSLGKTSKRGLSAAREGENPYQELHNLLLDDSHQSKRRGHAQHEEPPPKEKERSKSPAESMEEDVALRRR
ncbi:hypothetical protein L7F22_026476 [Adiantum nelumboides]|nr:hypothetical protein [Adiantum nelumboides]